MFSLRFQRQGKKKDFVFRVVAIDSRFAINSGKAKEILGWWDPRRNTFDLKKERILYWLQQGAQPSDSCYNLLIRAKIIEGKKRVIKLKPKKKAEETSEEATPKEATSQEETASNESAPSTESPKEETPKEEVKEEVPKEEKKEEQKEVKKEEPKQEEPAKEQPEEKSAKTAS